MVYWTSGRSRKLNLGKLVLHLEHVASWQLVLAKEPAGEIVRFLAWAGLERVDVLLKAYGTNGDASGVKRTHWTGYWERIGSAFDCLGLREFVGLLDLSDCSWAAHIATQIHAVKTDALQSPDNPN